MFAIKDRDVRQVLDDLLSYRVCGIVNLAMFTCDFSWYDIFIEEGIRLINCTKSGPKVIVDYTKGMLGRDEMSSIGETNEACVYSRN